MAATVIVLAENLRRRGTNCSFQPGIPLERKSFYFPLFSLTAEKLRFERLRQYGGEGGESGQGPLFATKADIILRTRVTEVEEFRDLRQPENSRETPKAFPTSTDRDLMN